MKSGPGRRIDPGVARVIHWTKANASAAPVAEAWARSPVWYKFIMGGQIAYRYKISGKA